MQRPISTLRTPPSDGCCPCRQRIIFSQVNPRLCRGTLKVGQCRESAVRRLLGVGFWLYERSGPSKGPAIVTPPTLPEDTSWQDTRVRPWWHTRGAMPAPQRGRGKPEAARTAGMAIWGLSRVRGLTLCSRGTGMGGSPARGPRGRPHLSLAIPPQIAHRGQPGPTDCWHSYGIMQRCRTGEVLSYSYTTLPCWRSSCASRQPCCASS